MGFTAKDTGNGDFKRVPPGAYIGRCYAIIDMGTQVNEQYAKSAHKVQLRWELFGEDEAGQPLTVTIDSKTMPMTISKSYTLSLHEKAGLRKDLAAWRGKDFTADEAKAFDVSKLLGAFCMVNVTQSENNGKTYSNVAGLTPLPGALKASKPAGVHALVKFDIDDPDMALLETFSERMQELIKGSPEWQARGAKTGAAQLATAGDVDDDDIPF